MSDKTYVRFVWWIGTDVDGSQTTFRFMKGAEKTRLFSEYMEKNKFVSVEGPFTSRKKCLEKIDAHMSDITVLCIDGKQVQKFKLDAEKFTAKNVFEYFVNGIDSVREEWKVAKDRIVDGMHIVQLAERDKEVFGESVLFIYNTRK